MHLCCSTTRSNTTHAYIPTVDDDIPSSRTLTGKNIFCELDDQNTGVSSVRSVTHKHSGSKKKKPKSVKESETKSKEDNDDDLLDLCIKNNSVCNYSGCKKNIKLLGQTCQFCCKLFCLSHHQAELHGCGEEAKIAARKESLQQISQVKTLNNSKRKCLQKRLEKNINDLKSQRQPKKQQ